MNDGPKLERIPVINIEPIHFHFDDSKKNKIKSTSFSDEAHIKRRKSAFNKHPREYSDVYDINLINEESPNKNVNDQIKKQLLGLNKKNLSIERMNPFDNIFGNEKERLQNQLSDIIQTQINIQSKAEKDEKFYEDKKQHLQTVIEKTNPTDLYNLHSLSLEKEKRIGELKSQIQNKKNERIKEQKEYYDELYKAISLKNLLIKEIREMIDIANKVPSYKESDQYNNPIEIIRSKYLLSEESQEDMIHEGGITTEIKKTNMMPSGLNEDNTLTYLQMNATEKYFFNINNYQDKIERTKVQNKEKHWNSKKQQISQSQPQIIQSKRIMTRKEEKRDTILLRDIHQDNF